MTRPPPPGPMRLDLLIDTGADRTMVDADSVALLRLESLGKGKILTLSSGPTPHICNIYKVSILIPCPDESGHLIRTMRVYETDFSGQNVDGVLGRDVLSQLLLIVDGKAQEFTLAY